MDKIFKNTALAILVSMHAAMAQTAPVSVFIEDFKIQSFTERYALHGAGLKDILLFGLLRDSTIIIKNKAGGGNGGGAQSQHVFVISGTASLYKTEFYCSIDITDRRGNRTKLPEIYGKHKDFYPAIEKLSDDILSSLREMRVPKRTEEKRVAVNLTLLSNQKKESVNRSIGDDILELYQQALSGKGNFVSYDLKGRFSGPANYDFDSAACVVDLQVYFRADEIIASPTLFFDKGYSLVLPSYQIDAASNFEVLKESLRKDYENLYGYILNASGDFDLSKVKQLDSIFNLSESQMQALSGRYLYDSTEMPSVLIAGIAARRFSSSWDAHMQLGKARLKFRRYQEAAYAFQHAIRQNPARDEAHMYLGHSYFNLGLFAKSIRAYQVPLAKPANDPYFQNLGSLSMLAGKSYLSADSLRQAERMLSLSITNHPDLMLAHYYLGVVQNRLEQFNRSVSHLKLYLSKYPGDKNARQWLASSIHRMGMQKIYKAQYDSAEYYFLLARKYKGSAAIDLGLVYAYNGQTKFRKSDSLISKNIDDGTFDKSTIYFQHGTNLRYIGLDKTQNDPARKLYLNEALRYLSKNAEQNGKQSNAALALGNSQVEAGEFSKAVKSFKEALKIDPSNIDAKLNQAEALIMAGDAGEVAELLPDDMFINTKLPPEHSDYLLMLYLRVVADQIQMDRGKKTPEECNVLMNKFNEALGIKSRIFNWSYDIFKTWLASYQGNGKSTIADYTTKMEKRTF